MFSYGDLAHRHDVRGGGAQRGDAMRKKSRARRAILMSGLPQDAVMNCARATLFGRNALLVEGQRGVVEMADACIRLRTQDGVLSVCGENLVLMELSLDAAMIRGDRIDTVSYGQVNGRGGLL